MDVYTKFHEELEKAHNEGRIDKEALFEVVGYPYTRGELNIWLNENHPELLESEGYEDAADMPDEELEDLFSGEIIEHYDLDYTIVERLEEGLGGNWILGWRETLCGGEVQPALKVLEHDKNLMGLPNKYPIHYQNA